MAKSEHDLYCVETSKLDLRFSGEDWGKWSRQMISDAKAFLNSRMGAIEKAARSNVGKHEKTGALKSAIKKKVIVKQTKDGTLVWAGVGIDSKTLIVDTKNRRHRPVKYAHLISGGFSHRNGKRRIAGTPFLWDAAAVNGGANIGGELKTIVDRSFRQILNLKSDVKNG